MQNLITFDFDGQAVRTIEKDGIQWWVAQDICRCLDIKNSRDALSRLNSDEKDDVGLTDTIGRKQNTTCVNEPGLYRLILTSRKKVAEKFKRWITHDILPSIRETGEYRVENYQPENVELNADTPTYLALIREARLLFGKSKARYLWNKLPLPQIEEALLLGQSSCSDEVKDFLISNVTTNPSNRLGASNLYNAYKEWFEKKHPDETALTQTSFGMEASTLLAKCRHNGRIYYIGYALK